MRRRAFVALVTVPVAIAALLPAALAEARSANPPVGAAGRQQAYQAATRAAGGAPTNTHTPDDGDLADQQDAYANERIAPGVTLSGQALLDAASAANALPATGGAWQEFTTQPYNASPASYTDPFWGNQGSGFGIVSGRATALVEARDGTWFVGTADGGVWKSTDQGAHWTATFDGMASLAIGALAIDPVGGSLWAGTGEPNTSQDSFAGTGVYRSTNDGATWHRVGDDSSGGNPLVSRTVFGLTFDASGTAYAATNNGLFRMGAGATTWTEVLAPAGASAFPPYPNQVTSVAVVPGSGGQDVIAAVAWRSQDYKTNGFYESTDGGNNFSKVTISGAIHPLDIGRTTFAYSADGSKLYATVESPHLLNTGAESVLQGIFVASGSPASVAGPWTKIAGEDKLAASGSALAVGSGYGVGVQAWYNQDLAVDPSNPNHIYAGLEEVFESTNGGKTWVTASPYWNYGLACGTSCPSATHPDQHGMMIADGKIVIANDGGVYSRPLSDTQQYGDWSDLNSTLRTFQYYDARAGVLNNGSTIAVGGLQDNGTSVLVSGQPQMAEPAGGDGFNVIVDPNNGNRWIGEYTNGAMYSTSNGGRNFAYYVSPTCVGQKTVNMTPRADCDPAARFVTPLNPATNNVDVWLTGGQYVWVSKAGWATSCTDTACSWQDVYDVGAGNAVTALASADSGKTIYAAWVGGGGNPGPAFGRGIATNYGGTWHELSMAGLPNRYIAGVTVDPANPAHAYAIFNGYSRQWIPGGGVGHVFETTNGGASWTDISGNLPDIASNALVLENGKLALATDLGAYTAVAGKGAATTWSRLGSGLPNAAVDDITVGPNGYLYAATHGRGIWRLAF